VLSLRNQLCGPGSFTGSGCYTQLPCSLSPNYAPGVKAKLRGVSAVARIDRIANKLCVARSTTPILHSFYDLSIPRASRAASSKGVMHEQKAKSDAAEAKAAAEAAKRTPASLLTGVVAPPQHWALLADRAALLEMHWLPLDGAGVRA